MANYNVDGYFDVHFNGDRTQVIASFYPPKGAGKNVSSQDILDRLQRMNVVTGLQLDTIENAIQAVAVYSQAVQNVVVAQGQLPVDGTDARIVWKIDEAMLVRPLPRRAEGLPDYFAYPLSRRVNAGQALAGVIPGSPGTPGRILTPPYTPIPQKPGRSASLSAGEGIRLSDDRLQYFAAVEGFLEYRSDRLTVTALGWQAEDLVSVNQEFPVGLLCQARVHSCDLRVQGPLAVRGTILDSSLRAHGDIYVHRAENSRLVTDGNIFVLGALIDCDVIAQGKVISLDGGSVAGGKICACQGVEACDLGTEDFAATKIVIGSDDFATLRMTELQEEMKAREVTVQKIRGALKPLLAKTDERTMEQKNRLVQTLVEQRHELEARLRDLHNQKRALTMLAKERDAACVNVSGTTYPGVHIVTTKASTLVEFPQTQVSFLEAADGRSITMRPLSALRAA